MGTIISSQTTLLNLCYTEAWRRGTTGKYRLGSPCDSPANLLWVSTLKKHLLTLMAKGKTPTQLP